MIKWKCDKKKCIQSEQLWNWHPCAFARPDTPFGRLNWRQRGAKIHLIRYQLLLFYCSILKRKCLIRFTKWSLRNRKSEVNGSFIPFFACYIKGVISMKNLVKNMGKCNQALLVITHRQITFPCLCIKVNNLIWRFPTNKAWPLQKCLPKELQYWPDLAFH